MQIPLTFCSVLQTLQPAFTSISSHHPHDHCSEGTYLVCLILEIK